MITNVLESIAGLTDVGRVRKVNEDAFLIDENAQLFAIADGMGGHGSGDIASQLALETLQNCIAAESVSKALSSEHITDQQALALVFQAIAGVNQRIFQENEKQGCTDGTGMGTTLVGMCKFGNAQRAISFNTGDSRLYEYRDNRLRQLTKDHTMYRDWEEAGKVGPAPPRNIILRAVGLFADVDIDLEVLSLDADTSYLLCSDGLSGMVSDEEISSLFSNRDDAASINETLVKCANEHGGTDNISVVSVIRSSNVAKND